MPSRPITAALMVACAATACLGPAAAEQAAGPGGAVELSASPWRVAVHQPVEVSVRYQWRSPWHAAFEPSPAEDFAQQEVLAMAPAERTASGGSQSRLVRMRVMPPGVGTWTLPQAVLTLVGPDGSESVLRSPPVEVFVTDKPGPELPVAGLMLPLAISHPAWWRYFAVVMACAVAVAAWARVRAGRVLNAMPPSPDQRFDALVDRARATLDPRAAAALLALALRQRAGDACGFDGASATAAEVSARTAHAGAPAMPEQLGTLLDELDGLRFAPAAMAPQRLDALCARALTWRSQLAAVAAAANPVAADGQARP